MTSDGGSQKERQECGCFEDKHSKNLCPPIRNVTHPLRYYEFTQEEIKALEECDKESFYRRCLPLSGLFAGTTYALIKAGCLKRNRHFGAVPKLVAAVLAGHLTGRALHAPVCNERWRALPPPSRLGEVLRKYHEENKR